MVLSQCFGIIKYTIVFINLIFWALGLIAVILGVWMISDQTSVVSGSQELQNFQAGIYIMIATGVLLVIVSFVAICGVFRESQSLLIISSSCFLVIIVILLSAGAWLYTNRHRMEPLIKSVYTKTVKDEYGVIDHRTETVDTIQSEFGCCGANGPSDWASSIYGKKDPNQPIRFTVSASPDIYYVPPSCCKQNDPSETLDFLQESDSCKKSNKLIVGGIIPHTIYNKGCTEKLIAVVNSQGYIFFEIIIGLGFIELIGLLLSMILCCSLSSPERYKA